MSAVKAARKVFKKLEISVALIHQTAYPRAKQLNKKKENDANCKIEQWR